jgi:hypothetical protein
MLCPRAQRVKPTSASGRSRPTTFADLYGRTGDAPFGAARQASQRHANVVAPSRIQIT